MMYGLDPAHPSRHQYIPLSRAFSLSNSPPSGQTTSPLKMRLGSFLLAAIVGFLACDDVTASISESTSSKLTTLDKHPIHGRIDGFTAGHDNKRALRSESTEDEDGDSDDSDHEDRDLIISTINRPKYWRWFDAGMTPYDVQQVLGLTGIRRLWKPIKRREYKGYVVFYTEQCHKPKYHDFCKKHADQ